MKQLIVIAGGGALGCALRFLCSKGIGLFFGTGFPFGILGVNIIGSFAMGFLSVLFLDSLNVSSIWSNLILVGFLGGFTTFSSFSIDIFNLFKAGTFALGFLYIFASVGFSILAVSLGVFLGKII